MLLLLLVLMAIFRFKFKIKFMLLSTEAKLLGQLSLREGTFFIRGGGGWAGASEGRVISKFLENEESQTFWSRSPGKGHRFFITQKKFTTRVFCKISLIIKIQTPTLEN